MLSIILSVIIGVLFTFVASQNPGLVSINLLGLAFSIPLYLAAAVCFLAGIFISLIFHLFDLAVASFNLQDREGKIVEVSKNNQNLQDYVKKLTIENTRLREELGGARSSLRREQVDHRRENVKSFFTRLKQSFN